jgi:RNA polymerase sigma-70 factor (ECF subfamily)
MRYLAASGSPRGWEGVLADQSGATTEGRFLRMAASDLDRAYRLAGFLLGDARDAEDATQDALVRAWRSIGSLRDPAGFRPWFDRILVNVCRDRLRRRKRIRFLPLDGAAELAGPGDPFAALIDRDDVLARLAVLDADERIVVVLHFWADLTLAGVAERLGWPIGTVSRGFTGRWTRWRERPVGEEHVDERAAARRARLAGSLGTG